MAVQGEGGRCKTLRGEGGIHVAVESDKHMKVREGGCFSGLASGIPV